MSRVVDTVGNVDPDVVHTSGDQTIDGTLTVGESGDGEIVVVNDDLVNTLGYGLTIKTNDNTHAVQLQDSSLVINPGDEEMIFVTQPYL
jgi:hypothetical protein